MGAQVYDNQPAVEKTKKELMLEQIRDDAEYQAERETMETQLISRGHDPLVVKAIMDDIEDIQVEQTISEMDGQLEVLQKQVEEFKKQFGGE